MTSCTELQNFIDHTKNQIKSNSSCDLTSSQLSLLLSIFHQYLKIDINQQLFTPSNVVRFQTIEQPMTPIFVHTTLANKIQFTRLYTGIFPVQSLPTDPNRTSANEINQFNRRDLTLVYHPTMNYNSDLNHIPRLGPHQLPSICLFTLKTKQIVNCMILSNDCELLALGFQSSEICICSLNPMNKLYAMKSVKDLRYLLSNYHHHHHHQENILETKSSIKISNERILIGHTGAIFALAFEPTKQTYLLSGSQDCALRLWHLATWSCLVVYKMHFQPILNGNRRFETKLFVTLIILF
jgi:WD40 repeat protein